MNRKYLTQVGTQDSIRNEMLLAMDEEERKKFDGYREEKLKKNLGLLIVDELLKNAGKEIVVHTKKHHFRQTLEDTIRYTAEFYEILPEEEIETYPSDVNTYVSQEEFEIIIDSLKSINTPEAKERERKALELLRKIRGW